MMMMTMIMTVTMKKQITGLGKKKSQGNHTVDTTTTTSGNTKIESTRHSSWEVI
jgi:hypothetical protein